MNNKQSKATVSHILAKADIKINGSRPWDVQIHNEAAYARMIGNGSIGIGESYMEGWWDAEALDQTFTRIFVANVHQKISLTPLDKLEIVKAYVFNLQTKRGSNKVAKKHYDLSNDLFNSFLDPYNQYSCGYFKNTKVLNQAQEQKLDLICKKLYLTSKDSVLDIGCGWGGLAKYAAEHYGCSVTGITISKEQAEYAKGFTKGLPVKILLQDYRDVKGKYSKVVSVGMMEHVGHKNYRMLMEVVNSVLNDKGLFLLHTIGVHNSKNTFEPWTNKYIFPNSEMPTIKAVGDAIDGLFILEDCHNFGAYYDPTLMAWYENFDRNWDKVKGKYDDKFYRMFKFFLLSSAATFRARINQLWQIVLSKHGVIGGYQTFR